MKQPTYIMLISDKQKKSINFQMYTRASASDWNDFKMEGWTAKGELKTLSNFCNS